MSDNISRNKRIAKNTMLLYFRMIIMMGVNFYTSRVVLQVLGIDDFGIYTAVGGVVALFGIMSNSLSTATQRFITHALGKNDQEYLSKIFSTSLLIHIVMCILIVILAESVGLWFLTNEMQIPADKTEAAFWVYQCSVVSAIIMIVSVPYNATIIAHEKMGAFATISLFEVFLKLGIVYLLYLSPIDKLVLYSILLVFTQLCIRFCYTYYCKRHFEETKIRFTKDIKLIKEIGLFSTWSLLGNAAYISYTQGLNVLLNMFFAPAVNAARGIAVQVQSAVNQFVLNFQTAMNPQITKSYASGEYDYMHSLVFKSARFSFFMLYILSLPILIECDTILGLWLTVVPEYTVIFLRLILLVTWINAIANPLIISVKATGKIKVYELVVGGLMLTILPISYIFLKLGYPPYSIFIVNLCVEIVAQIFRIWISHNLIHFSVIKFFKEVIIKSIVVAIIAAILPLVLRVTMDRSILSFFVICTASLISSCIVIYYIGLSKSERVMINDKVKQIINRFKR